LKGSWDGLIKELEAVLGLPLDDRSTRHVHLTDVGASLAPQIGNILRDLDGALESAADLRRLRTGVVRVATSQLLASTLLPPLIAQYQTQHPAIRVQLVDCAVETVMARVVSGEVDFGIDPSGSRIPTSSHRCSAGRSWQRFRQTARSTGGSACAGWI
jgi:DNA-binding transcriptional LysR family regulator